VKAAIVTRYPRDPDAPRGGVEAVSVNLVRALRQLPGLDIHVITTEPEISAPERESSEGVPIHRLPRTARRLLAEAIGPGRRQMRRHLEALAPDVVHSHDVYGLMVVGLPIPRVFTIHGFIHADTRVAGERFALLRSWLWRRYEVRGWADQPHIVSISPYVRTRLSGLVTSEIHDIENPVAEAFFTVERREMAGTIFSAALIEPRKNTLGLVEAVARLAARGLDVRLRLAGAIRDPEYGRRVEALVASRGLRERVSILGPISSSRVREELAQASVFALVSLEENAPMGIEEAMAAGIPVVASNRCGMPYMVRHGESGFLVDPLDPADVAERLAQVLGDASLGRSLGGRARAIARDRFHPEAVARRTRDVYEQAVRRRG
jgi:glycosyltransferase involved in cell wall biosynthesis